RRQFVESEDSIRTGFHGPTTQTSWSCSTVAGSCKHVQWCAFSCDFQAGRLYDFINVNRKLLFSLKSTACTKCCRAMRHSVSNSYPQAPASIHQMTLACKMSGTSEMTQRFLHSSGR